MKRYAAITMMLLAVAAIAVADDISELTGTGIQIYQEDIVYGTGLSTDTDSVSISGTSYNMTKVPDPNADEWSIIKKVYYVSDDDAITDHSSTATEGCLGWINDQRNDAGEETHVILPGDHTYVIDNDLSIDADILLEFQPGALLDITNGATVTFNGPISAPDDMQIFSLDSSATTEAPVLFAAGSVAQIELQWFYDGTAGGETAYAFNAAIASASNKGIPVHVAAGDYTTTQITLGDFGTTTVDYTTLLLDPKAVLTLAGSSDEDLLNVTASYVNIKGGVFDGNRGTNTLGDCIHIASGTSQDDYVKLEEVEIYDCDENGIYADGDNISITKCRIHDVDEDAIHANDCDGCWFDQNTIDDITDDGVQITAASSSVKVFKNNFTDIGGNGVSTDDPDTKIFDNQINITGSASQASILLSDGADGANVFGNTIEPVNTNTTYGIMVDTLDAAKSAGGGATIYGNTILSPYIGIYITDSDGIAVTGNNIRASYFGAYLDATDASDAVINCAITDNFISTSAASSTGVYLYAAGASANVAYNNISNNVISDGGSMSRGIRIYNFGGSSTIQYNLYSNNTIIPDDNGTGIQMDSNTNDVIIGNVITGTNITNYDFTDLEASSGLICHPTIPVTACFRPNTDQTYATVNNTEVDFGDGSQTEAYDFANECHLIQSGTGDSWKITAQRPINVRISVMTWIFDNALVDDKLFRLGLRKNGVLQTNLDYSETHDGAANDDDLFTLNGSSTLVLDKDDEVTVVLYNGSAADITMIGANRQNQYDFCIEEIN